MLALCQELRKRHPDLKLSIASTMPALSLEKYITEGTDCFIVPMRNKNNRRQRADALKTCIQLVEKWAPDVIHIHGTERFFGLLSARNLISVPTVISIQGLVQPYSEWYHYFGNRSLFDIIKMHRFIEIPVMRGAIWDYYRFQKNARREREIMSGNRHFMGRTEWDRAHLYSINPKANYYYVGEVLREPFWNARWNIGQCQRHRIVFTNPGHPRKGVETLFEAADILKRDYPDLEVVLIGAVRGRSGYGRFVRQEVMKRDDYVRELGALNAEEMANELKKSHVFVSPSYIENSSNAVCEAQLVGVPVVSSYTGGIPTLVENRRTGMFFPPGDAPCLASTVGKIFEDDELAKMLSQNAQTEASKRHDAKTIIQDLLNAYDQVINHCQ